MRHFFVFAFLLITLFGFSQETIKLSISAKNKQGIKVEGIEVSLLNSNQLVVVNEKTGIVFINLSKGY